MTTLREFADDLRSSANIVDIISAYITLKRSGANYKATCPFHKEKTPSFMVSPARQIFHCFGCGAGGDVVKFVMMFEKVSFRESLELLAKKLGKPLPQLKFEKVDTEKAQYRNTLLEIHEHAQKFYKKWLEDKREGAPARAYLLNRGLTQEIIDIFSLGYATPGDKRFIDFARDKGYSDRIILDAGLGIKRQDSEGFYDRFRQRLIFPIRDHLGRCIAFGGRGLTADAVPKYLNSPETPIYSKSQVLYGLDVAKQAITEKEFAIISEGYFDVITLHQFGFTNSVATCGTALTEQQARLLKRFCSRVLFLYDGDEAGEQAMLRGAEVLFRNNFQIRVLLLPREDDPDTFLRREGADVLNNKIERESVDLVEFFVNAVRQRYDMKKAEGKVAALDLFRPLLTQVDNVIYFNQYTKLLSEELNLDQQLVKQYLDKGQKGRKGKSASGSATDEASIFKKIAEATENGVLMREMALLRILLDYPSSRSVLRSKIECCWLTNPKIQQWVEYMLGTAAEEEISINHLLEKCDDEDAACLLRQAALFEHISDDYEEHLNQLPSSFRCRYEKERRRQLISDVHRFYELDKQLNGVKNLLRETHMSSQTLNQVAPCKKTKN